MTTEEKERIIHLHFKKQKKANKIAYELGLDLQSVNGFIQAKKLRRYTIGVIKIFRAASALTRFNKLDLQMITDQSSEKVNTALRVLKRRGFIRVIGRQQYAQYLVVKPDELYQFIQTIQVRKEIRS